MQPVKKHKENLINWLRTQKNDIEHMEHYQRKVLQQQKEIDFYEYQIQEAERMGKKEFNRDRFKVKKVKEKDSE